jgi:6-phosphogluconolactonase
VNPEPVNAYDKSLLLYVGTYNLASDKREKHPGIYVFRFHDDTGRLTPVDSVSNVANPSFLCFSADARFLYTPNEIMEMNGESGGGVAAFALSEETDMPTLLNRRCTGGGLPCHVTLDRTGKWLLAGNYRGGSFAVFPVQADGAIGPRSAFVQHRGSGKDPARQESAHVHSCIMDPSNRFLMVADLGLDRVAVYELDKKKGTVQSRPELWTVARPGAGPRHMAFHPNGLFFYVVNELDSTVSAFIHNAESGRLEEFQTIAMLPPGFTEFNSAADIHIHPNGRFLYASNRGHDSIAIYSINPEKGRLALLGHSSTLGGEPRNFALAPSGKFLLAANQKGNN